MEGFLLYQIGGLYLEGLIFRILRYIIRGINLSIGQQCQVNQLSGKKRKKDHNPIFPELS